jgi:hypothetical protein
MFLADWEESVSGRSLGKLSTCKKKPNLFFNMYFIDISIIVITVFLRMKDQRHTYITKYVNLI